MLLLRPGCHRPVLSVSRQRGHGQSRGGALAPSLPPSSSIPLLFHLTAAHISPDLIKHQSKTHYKIAVTGIGNCSWVVFRRYSDFQALQEKITYFISSFTVQVKFPPRHWFSFIIPLTSEEEYQRISNLAEWLSAVMAIATGAVRPSDATTLHLNQLKDYLNEFLGTNENLAMALKDTEEGADDK